MLSVVELNPILEKNARSFKKNTRSFQKNHLSDILYSPGWKLFLATVLVVDDSVYVPGIFMYAGALNLILGPDQCCGAKASRSQNILAGAGLKVRLQFRLKKEKKFWTIFSSSFFPHWLKENLNTNP